ncbi:thioredoxin family protein [Flagellimonas nanhaiensis]|uniref:Thioredoxin family protein n=1 Tax=Flagellimonas nanhaiensis TaxID=2292706 RepID=A0A371JUM8_9FLAO|nr:thioredoxin family protein [Allomuricauda nanhaiensis]RDY61487.1 thioredoxin family protein [Allomuricauda nanhaiensis]
MHMSTTIKILGTGCPKCKTMTKVVQEVVNENQIDATIEKVEDLMDIMKFNVMLTPALVIDDVIALKGRVPGKNEVLELLKTKETGHMYNSSRGSQNNCC